MTTRGLLDRFFAWRIDRVCMELGCRRIATHRIAFPVQGSMALDGALPTKEVDLRLCAVHALAYERRLRQDDVDNGRKDPCLSG